MITVHKYAIPLLTEEPTRMPRGAEILCLQVQNEVPCIWAKVDTNQPNEERPFYWTGTGLPLLEPNTYVGTIQTGPYVFHLFEFPKL